MTLTIHTISGASRGWRVLIGLELKSLDYDVHYLEASKREHKSPGFLKINPRGEVPVLDADGLLVRESIAILAWLDRQYPDSPLFGDTPVDSVFAGLRDDVVGAPRCCDVVSLESIE